MPCTHLVQTYVQIKRTGAVLKEENIKREIGQKTKHSDEVTKHMTTYLSSTSTSLDTRGDPWFACGFGRPNSSTRLT